MSKAPHGATHWSDEYGAYYKFPGGHVMTSAGWVPTTRSLDDGGRYEALADYTPFAVKLAKFTRAAKPVLDAAAACLRARSSTVFMGIEGHVPSDAEAFKEVVTRAAGYAPDHVTPDPRAPLPVNSRQHGHDTTGYTTWAVNGEACTSREMAYDVFRVLDARRVSAKITAVDRQGVEHRLQWVEWPVRADPFEPTPAEMATGASGPTPDELAKADALTARTVGMMPEHAAPRVDPITDMLRKYLPDADIAANSIEIGGALYTWEHDTHAGVYYLTHAGVYFLAEGAAVIKAAKDPSEIVAKIIQFDVEADPRYRA